jgi:hypothetical protein
VVDVKEPSCHAKRIFQLLAELIHPLKQTQDRLQQDTLI